MRTAASYALAGLRYWTRVFPRASRQLRRLRLRAAEIPDPALREQALQALAKSGNIEGAAAFAAFVPRPRRRAAIDALVLAQAIYNHADTLAEQPAPDRSRVALALHEALLDALCEQRPRGASYHPGDDGGYLAELVDACRLALRRLPGWEECGPLAARAAARIVSFQSLDAQGPASALERWASEQSPQEGELEWWELAGAAGSSLLVHAAIAAAAGASARERNAEAVERAYFPWIGGLHSLLDSALDEREDARTGQLSLVGCYESQARARARIGRLATGAAETARSLPRWHSIMLAAMAAHYVSELQAPAQEELRRTLRAPLGWPLDVSLLVFRARQRAARARQAPSSLRRALAPRAGALLEARALPDALADLEDA
jgi:tetraprenyl-beta-curcumene synthase